MSLAVRRGRGDRGESGPLEVVILVPAVLAIIALVVAFGRHTAAATDVAYAARVGARAAAQAQTAGGAVAAATAVVGETLAASDPSCAGYDVLVDASNLRPGGRVTVSVACTVSLGDVSHLGLAVGDRVVRASASEPVDRARGGEP